MIVKRHWNEILLPILLCYFFAKLIWGYQYSDISFSIIYWISIFIITISIINIIFLLIFPHCKIENEYLYLYINIFTIKRIYLPDIENIYEINDFRKGRGFKFILKTNEEVNYFPQNQTKSLLCKIKLFFENYCGEAK